MDRRVPEVRFKGFTDDWEQRTLGEMSNIYDGTHQTPDYKKKGVMFLSVEDIKTLHSKKFISKDDYNSNFKIRPQKGDILMTRIGDVGTPNVVRENRHIAYYVSLALIKTNHVNSLFLTNVIRSPNVQSELWKRTLHVAFPKKINKNEIGKIPLKLPETDEQYKIGLLMDKLNHYIDLQQEQLSIYKRLKKGFLQRLLPPYRESIPVIRFSDFDGKWKQRKLEELGTIFTGNTPSTTDNANWANDYNGHVWITPTDIDSLIISDSERHLSDIGWNKSRTVPAYSVLITSIASIGKNTINSVPAAFNQQINAIVPNNNDSYFILSEMIKNKIQFMSLAGKTATMIINKTEFKKFPIDITIIDEQKKISCFLKKIDSFVIEQQQYIEQIQLFKKYLLQKLFI